MALGPIPQNQLDALPLRTAISAAAPDEITIVGGTVTKYWGPTRLGIQAATFQPDPLAAGSVSLFSAYIDVSGCNTFAALLCPTMTAGFPPFSPGIPYELRMQYRTPGGTVLPASGAAGIELFTLVASRAPNFTGQIPAFVGLIAFTFSNHYTLVGGAVTGPGAVSTGDTRLWFYQPGIAANDPGISGYDCHFWAAT